MDGHILLRRQNVGAEAAPDTELDALRQNYARRSWRRRNLPSPKRRVALAGYGEYEDFVFRLPKYVADVARWVEGRIGQTEMTDHGVHTARKLISRVRRQARRA